MNKVTIYRYDENKPVRTLNLNGEPWFVLRDVCEVLGLGNSRMVADRLDEDEKGVSQIDTLGGVQNATIINESGLYNVILRSDKPESKPFRLTNFRETAKELGIKEKDFIGWLLDHKYVYRDQKNKLMPYAAKNNGLFEVKEGKGRHNDWAGTQTLITPKGRETFRLLCKEPPVLPQFTAL